MPDILIFGDSNTHGTLPLAHLGDEGRYPPGMRWPDIAGATLGPDWRLVVEGLPGRTATLDDPVEGGLRNGLRILPALLHSHKPLDLVVIALGTNEQKHCFGLGALDIARGIGRLSREVRAQGLGARLLLVSPAAVRERGCLAEIFAGAEARSAALPGHLEQVARAEGAAFFDAARIVATDDLDGVHLGEAAQAKLGAAMATAIRGALR